MSKEKVEIIQDIYEENNIVADKVNEELNKQGVYCINVMGSPGAGKTSSLVQIIKRLTDSTAYVLEGDIESDIDTILMKKLGVEAIQINTGGACHLDSLVIQNAIKGFDFKQNGILFIENIGNLVCPAEFIIGEHIKMLISSVAEGSDKPYKYPLAFEKADLILLNKADLKPYIDFDYDFYIKGVKALNPNAKVFEVSGRTGDGFDEVVEWLNIKRKAKN